MLKSSRGRQCPMRTFRFEEVNRMQMILLIVIAYLLYQILEVLSK